MTNTPLHKIKNIQGTEDTPLYKIIVTWVSYKTVVPGSQVDQTRL